MDELACLTSGASVGTNTRSNTPTCRCVWKSKRLLFCGGFLRRRDRAPAQHGDPEPSQPDDETQSINSRQAKRGQDNREDACYTEHNAKVVQYPGKLPCPQGCPT